MLCPDFCIATGLGEMGEFPLISLTRFGPPAEAFLSTLASQTLASASRNSCPADRQTSLVAKPESIFKLKYFS